ncbi:TetR/AcrR family transcriptional regulator [Nonomuraea sp. NPDC050790]|uniref:TetR/AcrR family transcriptional regulator n=1 Tax=Nonomuraea sp. NPDC050790 TaxID=3364371 RepID=UPI0037AF49B9
MKTKERIVRSTARLMQRQGYAATGLKQISQESGATLGSVYHFFPGGKAELAIAAVRHGGKEFADMLRETLEREDDPATAIAACADELAEGMRASQWQDGCPIVITALESAGRALDIQRAAEEEFAAWRELVSGKLRRTGYPEDVARELAHTVISTLEGAEMAAQVGESEEPLRLAGRHLARLITSYRP